MIKYWDKSSGGERELVAVSGGEIYCSMIKQCYLMFNPTNRKQKTPTERHNSSLMISEKSLELDFEDLTFWLFPPISLSPTRLDYLL